MPSRPFAHAIAMVVLTATSLTGCRTASESEVKAGDVVAAALPDALEPVRFDQAWSMFNHPLVLRIPEAKKEAAKAMQTLVPSADPAKLKLTFTERFAAVDGRFIDWTGIDISTPLPSFPDSRSIDVTYMIRAGLPNSVELTEGGNLLSPDVIFVLKDGYTPSQVNALAKDIRRKYGRLTVLPMTAIGIVAVSPMKHADDTNFNRKLILEVTQVYRRYRNHKDVSAAEIFSPALFHVDSIFGAPQPVNATDKVDINRLRTNEISRAIEADFRPITTVPALAPPFGNGPQTHPSFKMDAARWAQATVQGQVRFGQSHDRCRSEFSDKAEVLVDLPLYGWIAANPDAGQIQQLKTMPCLVDLFRLAIAPPNQEVRLIISLRDDTKPECRADITDNFEVIDDLASIGILIVKGTEEGASRIMQLPCVLAVEAEPATDSPVDPVAVNGLSRSYKRLASAGIKLAAPLPAGRSGAIPAWRQAQTKAIRHASPK